MDRKKELEICLNDIVNVAVIPSATNTHFSQICEIKKMAEDCLNFDKTYTDVVIEIKSKNERINELKSSLLMACKELESWNLTQGDEDTQKIIKECREVLRT